MSFAKLYCCTTAWISRIPIASLYSSSYISPTELRSSAVVLYIQTQTLTHPCLTRPRLSALGGLIKEFEDNKDLTSERFKHQCSNEQVERRRFWFRFFFKCSQTAATSWGLTRTEHFSLLNWRVKPCSWKPNKHPRLLQCFSFSSRNIDDWGKPSITDKQGGCGNDQWLLDVVLRVSRLSALWSFLSPSLASEAKCCSILMNGEGGGSAAALQRSAITTGLIGWPQAWNCCHRSMAN